MLSSRDGVGEVEGIYSETEKRERKLKTDTLPSVPEGYPGGEACGKPGVQLEWQKLSVCSVVLTVSSVREGMLADCWAIGLSFSYENSLVGSLWLSRQRKKAAGSRKGKEQS